VACRFVEPGLSRRRLDGPGGSGAKGLGKRRRVTVRRLVVEAGGRARQATIGWHQTTSLPGYATAFDILDGVIRQLSGGAVLYPSAQSAIASGGAELAPQPRIRAAPVSRGPDGPADATLLQSSRLSAL
jgi:hypothetical protein